MIKAIHDYGELDYYGDNPGCKPGRLRVQLSSILRFLIQIIL